MENLAANHQVHLKTNRIRVVVYRPRFFPWGAEKATLRLLKHVDRERFELILVVRSTEGSLLSEVPNDVTVHSLGGVRVLRAWYRLAKVLRTLRPDALLSISSNGNLTAAAAYTVARLRHCRLVLIEQNTFSEVRKRLLPRYLPFEFAKRVLYNKAHGVIAVSRGVADDIVASTGLSARHLTVIPSPIVDEALFRQAATPVAHPWFSEPVPVIVAAGRLADQKDFFTLLSAFRQVTQRHRVRLVILGEGPLRRPLEDFAESLGVAADVSMPGFVDNPYAYMSRCRLFVLSSKYEGLPTALIEAMACGAAVVSTDCPHGPAEILENGKYGLLVPVGDPESLAKAIESILDDPILSKSLASRGREVVSRYSVERVVRQIETVLAGSEDFR